MLRVIVFVNKDEVEDIQIVNTGKKNDEGKTIYETKCGDTNFKIFHNREEGWEVLLKKVLQMKIMVNDSLMATKLEELIKI